jgi:AcrR family transcriptional regulator
LSRARIIRAARRIAERDGVEVLTMRRLADEIGTAPMSLYRHVADKREVLLELLDTVAKELSGGTEPTSPEPRRRLIDTVMRAYRVLNENKWVVQALLAVEELLPRVLGLSEHMFAAMHDAGVDDRTAVYAHVAIWHYTWGHVFFGHLSSISAVAYDKQAQSPASDYPALSHVVPAMREMLGQDSFEVGLIAMVDGFLATSRPGPAGS